jgi:hypothetical protein
MGNAIVSSAGMNDDADYFELNCGGCGKKMLMRLSKIGRKFTIDCDDCERRRRTDSTPSPGRNVRASRAQDVSPIVAIECGRE